jgi:hypothetical protein
VSLDTAYECAGWCGIGAVGGKVYISDAESPVVTRYGFGQDGSFVEEGRIGFSDYTSGFASIELLLSPTKAYMTGGDSNQIVIWNPSTMQITGTLDLPIFEARNGIEPNISFNRGLGAVQGRVYASVGWFDYENYQTVGQSEVVIIDTENDVVLEPLPVPCMDMDGASSDAEGNVYLTNWVYSPGASLVNDFDPACSARVPSGSDAIDPAWQLRYVDVTGGMEGAALRYLGNNDAGHPVGTFSAFTDDVASYDPQADDLYDWLFTDPKWELWTVDLVTLEGRRVESESLGKYAGGYYVEHHEGQSYVLVAGGDYASTAIHTLTPEGVSQPAFDIMGWSTAITRVQ